MRVPYILPACITILLSSLSVAQADSSCGGNDLNSFGGLSSSRVLADGTILGRSKMNINIDGYAKAYHPDNAAAGALIHLCNAGQVYLPDGTKYHGSVDKATCTGKFMKDVSRIKANNWTDTSVGVVRWYGILGKNSARINGEKVSGIEPVKQSDGSGFYVSPTAFADESIKDVTTQNRYINPLRIPAAVIPNIDKLKSRGVVLGSFGVAIRKDKKIAVPFVVGDYGPKIGEGTPALARSLAGLPITDNVTRNNRFGGQVDSKDVIWVFFANNTPSTKYDANNENALIKEAKTAFDKWGGEARLNECLK
jgi:hypothetical protein